jgi:hypothetical protein
VINGHLHVNWDEIVELVAAAGWNALGWRGGHKDVIVEMENPAHDQSLGERIDKKFCYFRDAIIL